MKPWTIVWLHTQIQRTSVTQFDLGPLLGFDSVLVDTHKEELHALFTQDLDELDQLIRSEVEIKFAEVRSDFERTQRDAIYHDSQLARFVFANLAQSAFESLG